VISEEEGEIMPINYISPEKKLVALSVRERKQNTTQ
jgi:hypothetical protein